MQQLQKESFDLDFFHRWYFSLITQIFGTYFLNVKIILESVIFDSDIASRNLRYDVIDNEVFTKVAQPVLCLYNLLFLHAHQGNVDAFWNIFIVELKVAIFLGLKRSYYVD